jgi:adenylate cyclase
MAEPGTVFVSQTVYSHVRGKVQLGFDDLGEHNLKNMPEPVRAYRVSGTPTVTGPATKPITDRPSIAVLPFSNMSGELEQQYFSDGITEDIITELSRFRSLFVIARNSSFAFRDERIDISEIARRLGVQYVVEGSIRKSGNRVRITAQLIDAASGAHLWADRYDRDLEDIFAVQDEVVQTIVATVAGRVEVAGAQFAKRKPPESLVAYDYVLRGLEQLNLVGEEHNSEARHLFEKAVQVDPSYVAGHAYLALAIYLQWIDDRASGTLDLALARARQALALDENDSRCNRILSSIYAHMRQHDLAEFHSQRSVDLNPNDAHAAMNRALQLRDLGRAEEGIEWARKAMRLNPYHPNWYWHSLARVLHTAGRYDEALDAYNHIADPPSFFHAYVAACHAQLGRMDDARTHAALALEARPDFSVAAWGRILPFKNGADLQRFLDGLRKAGLPE